MYILYSILPLHVEIQVNAQKKYNSHRRRHRKHKSPQALDQDDDDEYYDNEIKLIVDCNYVNNGRNNNRRQNIMGGSLASHQSKHHKKHGRHRYKDDNHSKYKNHQHKRKYTKKNTKKSRMNASPTPPVALPPSSSRMYYEYGINECIEPTASYYESPLIKPSSTKMSSMSTPPPPSMSYDSSISYSGQQLKQKIHEILNDKTQYDTTKNIAIPPAPPRPPPPQHKIKQVPSPPNKPLRTKEILKKNNMDNNNKLNSSLPSPTSPTSSSTKSQIKRKTAKPGVSKLPPPNPPQIKLHTDTTKSCKSLSSDTTTNNKEMIINPIIFKEVFPSKKQSNKMKKSSHNFNERNTDNNKQSKGSNFYRHCDNNMAKSVKCNTESTNLPFSYQRFVDDNHIKKNRKHPLLPVTPNNSNDVNHKKIDINNLSSKIAIIQQSQTQIIESDHDEKNHIIKSNIDDETKQNKKTETKSKSKSKPATKTKKIGKRKKKQEEIEYKYDYNVITDENGDMYIDITIDIDAFNSKNPQKPQLQFYNLPNISNINEMVPTSSAASCNSTTSSCNSYQSSSTITSPNSVHSIQSSPSYYSSSSSSSSTTSLPTSPCHHYKNSTQTSTIISELQSLFSATDINDDDDNKLNQRQSILENHEKSIQKHESALLEILKSTNRDSVIYAIRYARCDVLCYFLPLIAFTLCQSDKLDWRLQLLDRLSHRIIGQSDLKQSVKFLLNAYDDITQVKAVFAGLSCDGNAKSRQSVVRHNAFHNKYNSLSEFKLFGVGNNKTSNKISNKISLTQKLPKDPIDFWNYIISMKLREGEEIEIPKNTVIRDPINQLRAPIRRILIRKIINSNSKPLLIDCFVGKKMNKFDFKSSTFILKYGDDLRRDKACMLVFKWMNHLFVNKCNLLYKKKYNVRIINYKVIPITDKLGCIELIEDCIPLRDILSLKSKLKSKPELINNLIVSMAGSYVASYILGIRDRHFDNILIRKTDFNLFHIDMNYVLGDVLKGIDANEFGITKELYDILNKDNYNIFINLACKAFQLLRQNNEEFINFTCLAFSYICDYKTVRNHILKQLRMSQSDNKAKSWLKNTLLKAPFDVQTQIKNKIHKFATR